MGTDPIEETDPPRWARDRRPRILPLMVALQPHRTAVAPCPPRDTPWMPRTRPETGHDARCLEAPTPREPARFFFGLLVVRPVARIAARFFDHEVP